MHKEQSMQGSDFINWLKDPEYQFELNCLDEEEVDKKVQEKTGTEQPDKEEPRDNVDVIKEGQEKGSRAITTSICYEVLKRSILLPLSIPESGKIQKQIRQKGKCHYRSFKFYFLLLLSIYPKERQTAEEYSKFHGQVEEGIKAYFTKNPQKGEFVVKAHKEIMRIVEATEHFFMRGDIEEAVNICYDGREHKSDNVGRLKTAKKKTLEVIKKYKQSW